MTLAVDWDIKPQTTSKQKKKLFTFLNADAVTFCFLLLSPHKKMMLPDWNFAQALSAKLSAQRFHNVIKVRHTGIALIVPVTYE